MNKDVHEATMFVTELKQSGVTPNHVSGAGSPAAPGVSAVAGAEVSLTARTRVSTAARAVDAKAAHSSAAAGGGFPVPADSFTATEPNENLIMLLNQCVSSGAPVFGVSAAEMPNVEAASEMVDQHVMLAPVVES